MNVELTKDQRDALLAIVNQASFQGNSVEAVVEIKKALKEAKEAKENGD